MCAIVDANVTSEVFGPNLPPAGKGFFDWLNTGGGRLVVGGKLSQELSKSSAGYRKWAQQAQLAGRVRVKDNTEVNERMARLQGESAYKSDDPHVLALAQVSGARLLYSNDNDLQQDFKDKRFIDNPGGSVYSTLKTKKLTQSRKAQLVERKELCKFDL